MVSRGGGGPEIPEGYALYIGGDIINIEGYERNEGNRFENNLKINWIINKIEADKRIIGRKFKCIYRSKEAVQNDHEQVNDIINQWWTKE